MGAAEPISEDAFRRLVRTLSAEQLRAFPRERLPKNVPVDALDEHDDPQKQEILDELAWGSGALEAERSVRLAEEVDPGTRDALETAEAASERGVDELNRITDEMARRWGPQDYGHDLLDEPTQRLEQARAAAHQLAERVGELSRALAVIDRPYVASEEFRERISAARMRARQVLSSVESALGRYELIEMDIAHGDMRAKQARCEDEARRVRELDAQIALVRDKLRRQGRIARRLLKPRVARQQREQLLQRLQALMEKRDAAESFVSEQDLLHWLDVLVEASLYVPQEDWDSRAQQTRLLLYRLLNVYCLQQETAAQQLADSPMLRANARDAIGYYLSSERFILRYFSRKRQEVTLWLSGAASEKLDQLDNIRDAILADYRRNARD